MGGTCDEEVGTEGVEEGVVGGGEGVGVGVVGVVGVGVEAGGIVIVGGTSDANRCERGMEWGYTKIAAHIDTANIITAVALWFM